MRRDKSLRVRSNEGVSSLSSSGRPPSQNPLDDEREFEVDTSVHAEIELRRDRDAREREQAAASEIAQLAKKERRRVAGTPPRGRPPAQDRPSEGSYSLRRSGGHEQQNPLDAPVKTRTALRARASADNPLDAPREQPSAAPAQTPGVVPVGFEEDLFNTDVRDLLEQVASAGQAPAASTAPIVALELPPTSRASASRPTMPATVAGATTVHGYTGRIVRVLLLLAVAAGVAAAWYYGWLDRLVELVMARI